MQDIPQPTHPDRPVSERRTDDRLRQLLQRSAENEQRLAADLNASMRLHELSVHLVNGGGFEALFEHVLDTAVAIMHSDAASMQMAEPKGQGATVLRLLAHRGFHAESARHWEIVGTDDQASCGVALRSGARICISDTEQCEEMRGTADLLAYRKSNIRAVQSTPLVSRSGRLLGMISTHWRQPYAPSESELRTFDILARQVADLIERKQYEEKMREIDQRKDEFLATLAHELRNPLAPIRNAVEVLRKAAPSHPQVLWSREVIERQVEHMARLLEDLLDVSRISRNRVHLRTSRITLASAIESALETSRPLLEAGHHNVTVKLPEEPVHLDADLIRLSQVFSNLLNNAAKYTPEGGQVWVSAELENRNDSPRQVAVSVKDNGIGIAADLLPRLFQMFTQAEPALTRAQGGLGIGLAVTKKLVELHGGTVVARSAGQGCGTEFIVRLPVLTEQAQIAARPTYADEPIPMSGQRILVVDDNRDNADSLAGLLNIAGLLSCTAYDGLEAIEQAEAFQPDVIVLDIGLPKMNGYEVCRRIRALPQGKHVVIVALTGWGQDDDRRKSSEAGFDGHLTKPVDYATLATLLATHARTRNTR